MSRHALLKMLTVVFEIFLVTACTGTDNDNGEDSTGVVDEEQVDSLEDLIAQMVEAGLEDLQTQLESLEDLQTEVESLKEANADLKDEVASLKAQVADLASDNASLDDRVGDLEDADVDAPRTLLHARVTSGGDVIQSPDVVSATRIDVGRYTVQFNRPISNYRMVATSTTSILSSQMVSTIAGNRIGLGNDVIVVQLFDSDGNPQDGSFHLIVMGD